ncbi:DUF6056 family protein, partial [Neobacillus drentensis]|uniref:DUF6056 family protein n=1 Tax=Neobacillus drentensis TaxID=220684 RepID=UPI002FFF02A1
GVYMILKKYKWFILLIVYFLIYLFHFVVKKFPGDDLLFSKATQNSTLMHWLFNRYFHWSARIFSDTMVYFFLAHRVWLWRLINPIFLLVLCYSVVRIWRKKVTLLEILIVLAILGYFAQNILSSGVFWITGSMYYLWPITLGLIAMIPYADKVFRDFELQNKYMFLLYFVSGFFASIGNEQVSLCLSCFAILTHIALVFQKKEQDKKLLLMTGFMIIGTLIMILSPGNKVRTVAETAYWFPTFGELSLKDHFYIGTIWGYKKIFSDMKYILYLLSVITLITYFKNDKLKQNIIFRLFTCIFVIVLILQLEGIAQGLLHNFEEIRKFHFSETLLSFHLTKAFLKAIFPYLFWTLYSFMFIYLLLQNTKFKTFTLFGVLAVIGTLVVMFFSPTIYGSGNRVLTVGSVILTVIIMGKITENRLINNLFYLGMIWCFPLFNLLYMMYRWLIHGFTPFLK